MAKLMTPRTKRQVAATSVTILRTAYTELADVYNQIVHNEMIYCHTCGDWKRNSAFYLDNRTVSGYYPTCKECLMDMALDYDKKNHTYTDNREKTIRVCQLLDLPFIESLYKNCLADLENDTGERKRATAYQSMVRMVKSFPQYKNMTWKDSEFIEDESAKTSDKAPVTKQIRKNTKNLFGDGFTEDDYWFLQNQYDDWCSRVQVDTKPQEMYVTQICLGLLDIHKARLAGEDVTKKLSALDTLMNAANLQPKQSVSNTSSDSLTFGQMLEKWEEHDPLPEPDPELQDVDGMTKYIHTWLGWILKALGIKNAYTQEYEEEVQKYTVTKPEPISEGNSQEIYDTVFGSNE